MFQPQELGLLVVGIALGVALCALINIIPTLLFKRTLRKGKTTYFFSYEVRNAGGILVRYGNTTSLADNKVSPVDVFDNFMNSIRNEAGLAEDDIIVVVTFSKV